MTVETPPATPQPFLDFYGQYGISPVHQDVRNLSAHLRRRRALYHRLGIPPTAVRGRRVIEFGPGTGHNAIATIQDRPALYRLVDGNPASIKATTASLRPHRDGVDLEVVHERAEDHQPAGDFDLVIAEGLIPFQLRPKTFARSLARHVAPGGILVVTCIDAMQYMGEFARRLIAYTLTDPGMPANERLRILMPVFGPHLRGLHGMSRRHDDWILDNLLIPHPGRPFSVAGAVEALSDFDVLGCSPRFHADARWYKTITDEDPGFNVMAVEAYRANVVNLLDCRVNLPPGDLVHGAMLVDMARELYDSVMACESAGRWPEGSDRLVRLVDGISARLDTESPITSRSLWELAKFLERPSFSAAITDLPTFAGFFGRGQAYVSFVKRR